MTDRLFIDQDGDACLEPADRDDNLVALPARDDDGNILNPEAWEQMVRAFNEADTAIPKAEADAIVAAALKRALDACMGEYLEDPQTDDDETYQQAVTDCCVAVQSLTPVAAEAAFEQAVREAVEAERARVVRLAANVCSNLTKNSRAVGYDEGWDDALDIAEQHILSIRAPQETSE